MIGPTDLNRIPRWTPERQTEELRRYAKVELGGELRAWNLPVARSNPLRGIRLWLSSRLAFARPSREAARAGPLRSNRAAVHFLGETQTVSRRSREPGAETPTILATQAMALCDGTHDGGRDEPLPASH